MSYIDVRCHDVISVHLILYVALSCTISFNMSSVHAYVRYIFPKKPATFPLLTSRSSFSSNVQDSRRNNSSRTVSATAAWCEKLQLAIHIFTVRSTRCDTLNVGLSKNYKKQLRQGLTNFRAILKDVPVHPRLPGLPAGFMSFDSWHKITLKIIEASWSHKILKVPKLRIHFTMRSHGKSCQWRLQRLY